MNTKLILRKTNILIGCAVVAIALAGCSNKNLYSSEGSDMTEANTFDFSTTKAVQLSVNYTVPTGYKVLFSVYTENPYTTNSDGQVILRSDLSPIITRMTDSNGAYSGKEVIPAYTSNNIYIYTSYIGVPQLYKGSISGDALTANITWDNQTDPAVLLGVSSSSAAVSRATENSVPSGLGLYGMGTWNAQGRPNYLDSEGTLTLSKDILNTIDKTIPESKVCPDKYRTSADFEVKEASEIKVRFIGGTSSSKGTFGYYCYPINATSAQIKAAKKYVVFPNTYTGAGIKGGECVKLHYIDANGVDQGTAFPAGVKLGWFLVNNGFNMGTGSLKSSTTYYSTTALNKDSRTHTCAFKINDFIVLGFEDWTDNDYNDVEFNIWSNPIKAISPDIPAVTPPTDDDLSVAYTMSYKGILAFEDLWPAKGDYDLNDVIMKYSSVLSYNTKNQVLSTKDTYTALWTGADYQNGFGYQLNTTRDNVICNISATGDGTNTALSEAVKTAGLDAQLDAATINLFTNAIDVTAKNTKTPTFTVSNTFKTPIDHETFGAAPYNPFIFVHGATGSNRTEVHLVNYKPTLKAKTSLFGTLNDLSIPAQGLYYVSSANYPFAINLSDATSFSSKESQAIDVSYPNFAGWVSSKGTSNKDWYLK